MKTLIALVVSVIARLTQQVLGVDRAAMDHPYQFVPEEVKVTDELPIGEQHRSKLYHLNAQRVFKL